MTMSWCLAPLQELPRPARWFVCATIAAGGTVLALHLPVHVRDWRLFAVLVLATSIASHLKLRLPLGVGSANLSVAYTVDFASLLLLGPGPTMLVTATSAVIQSTVHAAKRNPPHRVAFNVAALILTVQCAGWVSALAAHDTVAYELAPLAKVLVPTALAYYLVNTFLVAAAVSLSTGERFAQAWHGNFLWTAPSYFVGASAAGAATASLATADVWVLPFVAAAVYLTYRSYRIYIARMTTELRHKEQIQTLHAQALEALLVAKESEQRYALAAAGSNDGLWDWNIAADTFYCSDRWKLMLALEPAARVTRITDWFEHVHPEDLASLRAALDRHCTGESPHFTYEYRMTTASGETRWMLCRGVAVRDSSGRPVRMSGSQTDVTEWRRTQNDLVFAASHDALTGLPNRLLFRRLLDEALGRSKSTTCRCAVLFIDLDRFKYVNDSLGHVVGDRFLMAVAGRFKQQLRPGDVLARLGGDEFAILVDPHSDCAAAVAIAERIENALRDPIAVDGHEVFASASVGIGYSSGEHLTADDLLRAADTAMYRAKSIGRGGYQEFDPQMHASTMDRLRLETELHRAIACGAMVVHYQPIVTLDTAEITGFEALARWNRIDGTLTEPNDFIPIAEETGLIGPLTQWILEEACGQVARWQREFDRPFTLTVNASTKLFEQPGFVGEVEQAMARSEIASDTLRLEITESALMNDVGHVASQIDTLRSRHVQLYLDDFGTGYSSLSYLQRYQLDAIKIDRSFVSRITEDYHGSPILGIIISLARELGMGVIAEGVETSVQAARLLELQCSHAQGFWFSRPLSAPALQRFLEDAFPNHAAPQVGDIGRSPRCENAYVVA